MRFVDSHLHLGDADAGPALSGSAATQTLLLTCGTDLPSSLEALGVARRNPDRVKAFVGVHPSEAAKLRNLDWLARIVAKSDGIGEIGLDPAYSPVGPKASQTRTFIAQLGIAQKKTKPVQVHSRGAERAAIDVLGGFRLRGVLMHWFEREELLPEVLDRGYFVSFGPALLYSKKLRRMAARCPSDRALTETDSPVAYGPLGGVHGPSLVPSVVFMLAQLWGVRFEEARESVVLGSTKFLGLSGKG